MTTCPNRVPPLDGRRHHAVRHRMATIMPSHEPAPPLVGRAESAEERNGFDASGSTVTVTRIRPRDPVAQAVLVSLRSAFSRIRGTEGEARRGDVEGIHRLRTATRRLRSELRAFRSLVDAD